jgi:hypothetical protein
MGTGDDFVAVYMPSLASILVHAERRKGAPLTYEEVIRFRDESTCIMLRESRVRRMEESRGYRDIDPEHCWEEWLRLRDVLKKLVRNA